jgi:hypothetical protein
MRWAAARKGDWLLASAESLAMKREKGFGSRVGRVMLEGPGRERPGRAVGADGGVASVWFCSWGSGREGEWPSKVGVEAWDKGAVFGEGWGGCKGLEGD